MNVIDPSQAHPFGNHTERNAMRLLASICAMACPVQVQNQTVLACPFSHRLDRSIANGQIDHDDDTSQLLRKLGSLVHIFHRCSRNVHVMSLDFPGLSTGLVDGLYTIEETVTPAHERLRVDIFVILHKVQATAERLINDATIIAGGKTKFRLGGSSQ